MLFTSRIAPYIARYPPTKEKEEPPKACSQSASPGCNFARRALRVEMPHCPDHRLIGRERHALPQEERPLPQPL